MKTCPFNPEVVCRYDDCFRECPYFDKDQTLEAFQQKEKEASPPSSSQGKTSDVPEA